MAFSKPPERTESPPGSHLHCSEARLELDEPSRSQVPGCQIQHRRFLIVSKRTSIYRKHQEQLHHAWSALSSDAQLTAHPAGLRGTRPLWDWRGEKKTSQIPQYLRALGTNPNRNLPCSSNRERNQSFRKPHGFALNRRSQGAGRLIQSPRDSTRVCDTEAREAFCLWQPVDVK